MVSSERGVVDSVTAGQLLLLRLLLMVVVMRVMSVDVVTGILLLPLGAPVLKPDLDLRLGEAERQGEAEPLADGQVASQAELGLERRQLVVAERRSSAATARPAPVVDGVDAAAAGVCDDRVLVITAGTVVDASAV